MSNGALLLHTTYFGNSLSDRDYVLFYSGRAAPAAAHGSTSSGRG